MEKYKQTKKAHKRALTCFTQVQLLKKLNVTFYKSIFELGKSSVKMMHVHKEVFEPLSIY